jgi:hypothetical protein
VSALRYYRTFYGSPGVVGALKCRSVRWAGNVDRMGVETRRMYGNVWWETSGLTIWQDEVKLGVRDGRWLRVVANGGFWHERC